MSPVERESDEPRQVEDSTAEPPARHPHATPLPMNQMLPMTFVLLNESICGTMLLPFVGLLVSHLSNIAVEKAGYESGILIGVFMLGQMVSAKTWGRISDKYGRRFPIISGLFTSGLMMLGFGLSTNVWMCAVFRFFHGLFNGNVLVAKTMMADITDTTHQAKGFAFVSLCYGIGVLIGPTLGGLLYDPANSSALCWAHFDKDGFFSRHPAFLPSLVIFVYTNIGMTICTFFVMESNPHAKPLPKVLKFVYPCFWREPEMFVHPSDKAQAAADRATAALGGSDAESGAHTNTDEESEDVMGMSICTAEGLVANASMTRAVASLFIASPVLREDRRFDQLVAAETLTMAAPHTAAVTPHDGQITPPKPLEGTRLNQTLDARGEGAPDDASIQPMARKRSPSPIAASTKRENRAQNEEEKENCTDNEDGLIVVDTDSSDAKGEPAVAVAEQNDGAPVVLKRFGYKQAFQTPVARTMLIFYMLLSAADMAVQEIVPLWAIAPASVGGLGFKADKVGYLILTNSVPVVASNLLFHGACKRYVNKLSLYRISLACCGIFICILPFLSYFNLGNFLFITIVLCTGVRQFFASWAYGLVAMLTARSAPVGHVGSIMGINQACGALTRTLVPFVVTPLFAWSITSSHPFPFDHSFVFLLSGIVFTIGYIYSVWLRTDADANLELNHERPAWMLKVRDMALSCYAKMCHTSRGDAETLPSQ
ncbi:hypothetical protein ABB37_00504 [Leptomonas pyrrhocoris]|uniref:Major facilitator superfamily (MFS) profile domain-containing protein n=1 Tax=Leptomonas pyrrhocoris TaxID=157538 RepID=A0A0M9GAK8_LEPPY|nr:hypothetical protein ABB37_00504 [Leptomonas pyrrhocoris]KPA86277.1 hypothetical protein ABB37_00504 [Leptomonas pyrrhocoris]|eukprot:XP_015664716.1 hypothetical protein ABB37_00504 [Leptomonas pyrrhocoris]